MINCRCWLFRCIWLAVFCLLEGSSFVSQYAYPRVAVNRSTSLPTRRDRAQKSRNLVHFLEPRRRGQPQWDGDDLRMFRRIGRRIFRFTVAFVGKGFRPAQTTLIIAFILLFVLQTVNTVDWIRQKHPQYWPSKAVEISLDAIAGRTKPGPFQSDWSFSAFSGPKQPHRFITSGWIHAGVVPLVVNCLALLRLPPWVETGLGAPLYLTTFVTSVVAGNWAQLSMGYEYSFERRMLCSGAGGGISGLYGLMYISLMRMGNIPAAFRYIPGHLLLFGFGLVSVNTNNYIHIGGLLGGIVTGLLCGPSYGKSYEMRRKWSLASDMWSRGYRSVMGFGKKPTGGRISLSLLWAAILGTVLIAPTLRSVPRSIFQSLVKPGSLSGVSY